jgi:hypothetical protein
MWKQFQLDTSCHAGDMGAKQYFLCKKIDFEKNSTERKNFAVFI